MRDSLTLLAILLIGVLTAALAGPYLIDWDSHRVLIERKLSEAVGVPVTVAGPIDLKILPTPVLRFGNVAIGDGSAGRPRLSAAALDAEVSLTALMRGQVQVVDTTLVRPRLDLTEMPDGGFSLALPSDEAAGRIAVDHLGLRDATITLRRGDGRQQTLTGLDLDGEATTLRGPFKATGRVGAVPFRLATGALDQGRLRVKLHLDGADMRPGLDLDGTVADEPVPGRAGLRGPTFDGTATVVGRLPLDATPATVPWRMTAHLSAGRVSATASGVELRAGTDMRALIAGGDASASYGASGPLPQASVQLHGAVLAVDDLAVAPADRDIAPPKGLALVRHLFRLAGDSVVALPVRLAVAARFDTVTIAGRTLLGTAATLGFGPEPTAAVTFAMDGPDGTHLSLDGHITPGPAPAVAGPFGAVPTTSTAMFRGRGKARANDLRGTAAWLAPVAPDLASWLAAVVPGRSVAAMGDIEASGTGLTARNLGLRIDGSAFAGTLSFTRAIGTERARLFADLSSDGLDLDRLPDLSGAAAASRDLDLDLALSAGAVTLAHASPEGAGASLGPITAGHVTLRLTQTRDNLNLERLSLDLDGAAVEAKASRAGGEARGEAHVSAPQLGPVAAVFAQLLPAGFVRVPLEQAAASSPVDATLRVTATAGAGGALVPTRLALAGTAGATRFDATLVPNGSGSDVPARSATLSVHADAPEGADLLRQLGLTPEGSGLGAAHLDIAGQGTAADGFTASADAVLGLTTLAYRGGIASARGSGRATLRSTDLRPLAAAFGLGSPSRVASEGLAADIAGDLGWNGSAVALRDIAARIGRTAARGDLSIDLAAARPGGGETAPTLRGHLSLDRLPVETLLGLALGTPAGSAGDAVWSARPFAPVPATLPRSEVVMTVADLPLPDALDGHAVSFTLRTRPGAVTIADAAGTLRGGTFGGSLALRRDGPAATVSGHVAWAGIPLVAEDLSGRIDGALDVAGAGDSPAALVASLGGGGPLKLSGAALARTDPTAPARTVALFAMRDAEAARGDAMPDATPPDPETIRRALASALDQGPLTFGDVGGPATLAEGRLSVGPFKLRAPGSPVSTGWSAATGLDLDLRSLTLATRTELRGAEAGPAGADVVVTRSGPLGGEASRDIDAAGLVGAVQAGTVARAQERIDVMEQDIRERAAFNRQLKAIQADQQAARERAEADKAAAVARATAEAQARADAQRAAVEARRAEALRRKAEDARLQADVEATARADAAAKAEADKRRFFDEALKPVDPPLDRGTRTVPFGGRRSRSVTAPRPGDADPLDPPPPPSIIR